MSVEARLARVRVRSPVRGWTGGRVCFVAVEACFDMNKLSLPVQGALFPLFIVLRVVQFVDFRVKCVQEPLGE